VKTATRRKVADAVAQLGYVRQRSVYSLSHRATARVVAMAICEPLDRVLLNPFHARLLTSAERIVRERGCSLVVVPSPGSEGVQALLTGAIGGVLLVGSANQHPVVAAAAASGIPIRCVGRPPDAMPLPYIDVDNRDGARQAAEHLVLAGRRRIGLIGGPHNHPAAHDRMRGFVDTVLQAGLPVLPVAHGDFTYASGVHAMHWLLDRAPDLDAVFACADPMAAGAVHALLISGRVVPGDVAAIGFDDDPFARRMSPALTTVRQPVEELAVRAATLLLDDMVLRHRDDRQPLLPTELIVRESA
jgi:DNA-binding LacI/PurR family transcriptional regulator